ncbi:MAG: preprotein translocase subunit YajC [Gammaproteobacteria bacterium]|nr:preprotein translocase subunit YajC [Gammaproteobacteria bacterium]
MNGLIPEAQAQIAGGSSMNGQLAPLVMMVLFIVIFYFLLIRPQQKKAKEHQLMLGRLAAGDEVLTAAGILARITSISDSFVTVEIAEGVRIKVQKHQISSLVPKGTLKNS